MSVTHPGEMAVPAKRRSLVDSHPQLTPFLVAVTIFVVSVAVSLSFTGLPS